MPLSVDIFNKKILSSQSRFGKYDILLSGEAAGLPETIVYTTGDQTISGFKNFTNRPIVNGTGVLLSGEAASLPETIVYTTGNQIISGNKVFANDITVQGAILVNQVIDITTTGTISGVTGEFKYLRAEGGMISGDNFDFYADDIVFSGVNLYVINSTGIFTNRPLVNNIPVLLSGEAGTVDLSTAVRTTGNQSISGIKTFDNILVNKAFIGTPTSSTGNYILPLYRDNTLSFNTNLNFSFPADDPNLQSVLYVLRQSANWGVNYNSITWQNNSPGNPTLDKPRIFLVYRPNPTGTSAYGINLTEVASISQTVATTGNQTVNGIKNFTSRPVVNNTPILLSGEVYPNSNPSGFITRQNVVFTTGNQIISGTKIFRDQVYIKDLYVTGTETIVNTTNTNVGSNYLLLNATGGAIDAGIFIVTGSGFTGANHTGAIIGYDVPANRWVFGNTSRNSDLSQLEKIAGITDITNYSGFVNNNFYPSNNPSGFITGLDTSNFYTNNNPSGFITGLDLSQYLTGVDLSAYVTKSGGQFIDRPTLNGTGFLLSGEAAAVDLSTTVRTTGNQSISGQKTFVDNTDFQNDISVSGFYNFDITNTGQPFDGQMNWNPDYGTVQIGMNAGNVINPVGFKSFYRVKAAENIRKGKVVMALGGVGNSEYILAREAQNISNSGQLIMGVSAEEILANNFGDIVAFGSVRGVDTSTYSQDSILYYDPLSTGGFTNIPPEAPNAKVLVALNTTSNNNGIIFVRVTAGSELGGTDSNVKFLTLQNNDIIIYNSGSGLWLNSGVNFGSFYTRDNPSGFITDASLSGYYTNDNPSGFIITRFSYPTGYPYTIQLSDRNKLITVDSSTNTIIRVPDDNTYNIDIGAKIEIVGLGTGRVTILGLSGVEIKSVYNANRLKAQHSTASVLKLSANTWLMQGDLLNIYNTPADITGLQLWLDASDSSTLYDSVTGGSLVGANGTVARWEDKSSNANHATQSTVNNRPIRLVSNLNGLDGLDFDGTNDSFVTASPVTNGPCTIFVVAAPDVVNLGIQRTIHMFGPTAGQNFMLMFSNVSTYITRDGRNQADASTTTQVWGSVTANTPYIKTAIFRSTNTTNGYLNNILGPGTVTSQAANAGTQTTIGARNDFAQQTHLNGKLYEILVYNKELTDAERIGISNYLSEKWNIFIQQ